MNSNTICLRISYALILLVLSGLAIGVYGSRALTPLAVFLLPTETAQASYTDDLALVEYRRNSPQQVFHSKITYAGHKTTLLTTSPPTPPVDPTRETGRLRYNLAEVRAGLPLTQWEPQAEPTFAVRFVRVFPSMVVRDLPQATLWNYYADTWTTRDFFSFATWCGLIAVVAFFFWRHLENSRRAYRYY